MKKKNFKKHFGGIILGCVSLAFTTSAAFAEPFSYTSDYDGYVHVIDTATNTETATIAVPTGDIAVHPSGDFLYVTHSVLYNGSVNVIDTHSHSIVGSVAVGSQPGSVTIGPQGNFAYVTNYNFSGPGTVSVIDTSTNTVISTIATDPLPIKVIVHPSGSPLYVAHAQTGKISVIDTNTHDVIATVQSGTTIQDMAIHPSGNSLYVAGGTLNVMDTATNTMTATIATNGFGYSVAVVPSGDKIYVANYTNSTISVVDANTNTMTSSIPASYPYRIAAHPDGNAVYAAGFGFGGTGPQGKITIIDTVTDAISQILDVGQLPASIQIGPLPENVSGTAAGLSSVTIQCINNTTGQSVLVDIDNNNAWDCEAAGLQVYSGDAIDMVVSGTAK